MLARMPRRRRLEDPDPAPFRQSLRPSRRYLFHPGIAAAAGSAAPGGGKRGGDGPAGSRPGRSRAAAVRRTVLRAQDLVHRRAARDGLFRPPVRQLQPAARRRPRPAARRGGERGRRVLGPAPQGRRQDTLFAHGRWSRGAALVDPRIPRQRAPARPRHPQFPRAVRHRFGHPGLPRTPRAWRHAAAPGAEPRAFRPLRVLLLHPPARRTEAAARACHRGALPRTAGTSRTVPHVLPHGARTHRRADCPLAGLRLLPRGDEYRQHVDPRHHLRLRPLRLPR